MKTDVLRPVYSGHRCINILLKRTKSLFWWHISCCNTQISFISQTMKYCEPFYSSNQLRWPALLLQYTINIQYTSRTPMHTADRGASLELDRKCESKEEKKNVAAPNQQQRHWKLAFLSLTVGKDGFSASSPVAVLLCHHDWSPRGVCTENTGLR